MRSVPYSPELGATAGRPSRRGRSSCVCLFRNGPHDHSPDKADENREREPEQEQNPSVSLEKRSRRRYRNGFPCAPRLLCQPRRLGVWLSKFA
jgi:hypothetical protein